VQVTVVPGPLRRLVLTPAQAAVASSASQDFTLIGFDAGGNALPVTAHWAVTAAIGRLHGEGHFTATRTGQGMVMAYADGFQATAEVTVTPGPLALVFVTPQAVTARAGATLQFQAQGFDAHQNLLPALTPRWSVAGDIGHLDPATGAFTATLAGRGKVQATVGEHLGSADVVVTSGIPDVEQSRLLTSQVTPLADGRSAAAILVLVRDQYGNPIPDARVTLTSSRDDQIEQPDPSDQQGVATGRVRSTAAGLSVISAAVESVRLNHTLRLTFHRPGA
jgi:hypothetical protein